MLRSVRVLLAVAAAYAPASLAQSADRPAATAMKKASSDLTTSYLQAWSGSQAASPAYVARVYAPRIRFYGRTLDRKDLVKEKQRFVRRWPVRAYALRPGTLRVSCEPSSGLCRVASVLDWRAENPARRATSRGSSSFEQRVRFSADQPAVVHESGRVLSSNSLGRSDPRPPRGRG
jgi:hypothetical protein